jgi:hypothetical protein
MSTVAAVAALCSPLAVLTAAVAVADVVRAAALVAATEAGSVLIHQQCSTKTTEVLDSPELPAVAVAVAAE